MRLAVSKSELGWLPLKWAVFGCFALMSIYWVPLAEIGPFSLEAFHVGMLFVILVTFASLSGPTTTVMVLTGVSPWLLAYLAYLLFLVPALVGTPGLSVVVKQLYFATGAICLAGFFFRYPNPEGLLRKGALCGLLLFLILTEYLARQSGKSLIPAVTEFLSSGNFQALIFKFFRPVFNALNEGTDAAFGASMTNSVAGSLFVLSVCFRIGYRGRGADLLGSIVVFGALFLAVLLNARSVVLAALVGIPLAFSVRLMLRKSVPYTEMLYWSVGIVAFATLAFVAAVRGASMIRSIVRAFEFADNSAASRLSQYNWAFELIEESPILGHGYVVTDTGYTIHNLFLGAWVHVGIVGFILVVLFYVALLWSWLGAIHMATSRTNFWRLEARFEWVAVLPVLPLLRVWISGGGGHIAFAEWIGLAVFAGLLMRNDALRLQVRAKTNSPRAMPSAVQA